MVYCGKPSRSCHACRQRKTRCDAKPDGCTPCSRARRVCPGYRQQVDLMFRDESFNVVRKVKAHEAKKVAAAAASLDPQMEPSAQIQHAGREQELPPQQRLDSLFSIRSPVEEQAICYFFFHYTVGIQAPSRNILDNLAMLYRSNAVDDNLLAAVKAVSYANYAHHTHSSGLVDASRYQYTKAINLTNVALRNPEAATRDTTLMSIIILGMYEILTGSTQRSIKAWLEHIRGSSALLELRGYEQLKTPAGRRLFIQATTGILTGCVQLNVAIPKQIMMMVAKMPDYMDVKDDFVEVSFAIHQTMLDVNQFRAEVEEGTLSRLQDILTGALKLDSRMVALCTNLPAEFHYHTIRTTLKSDIAFRGFYHVYFDLLTANLWNAMRVFRTLLHQRIRQTLLQGFSSRPPLFTESEYSAQFQLSTDICYELQADILASVPQHLGYMKQTPGFAIWKFSNPPLTHRTYPFLTESVSARDASSSLKGFRSIENETLALHVEPSVSGKASPALSEEDTNDVTFTLAEEHDVRASGGYNLLWPLWFAGSMDMASEEIQRYAIKSLNRIGELVGVRQAFMLAKVIENKADIEAWNDKRKFEVMDDG